MIRRILAATLVLVSSAPASPWWDGGIVGHLPYRVPVEILNGSSPKEDYPITVEMNFTSKLLDVGEVGALDEGSVRIVKRLTDEEQAFGSPLPYFLERAPDFTTISNARGWISWIIEGTMEPEARTLYHVYFDIQAHGVKLEAIPLSWETIVYSPANLVRGGSFEPEASSVDQSRNPWRGWGPTGQPSGILQYNAGHQGRWSLALIPGQETAWEIMVGLLDPGRSYLLGGYVRAVSSRGEIDELTMNFSLGGTRPIRFSKTQPLGPPTGWWRSEIPLPIAPESPVFSVVFEFDGEMPDTVWVDDLFIYEDPPTVIVGPGERQ